MCSFGTFFKILKFDLWLSRLVLTKCWTKYYKSIRNLLLMFSYFESCSYLLMFLVRSPQNRPFFGGVGVVGLKAKDLGYVSGRISLFHEIAHSLVPVLCDEDLNLVDSLYIIVITFTTVGTVNKGISIFWSFLT